MSGIRSVSVERAVPLVACLGLVVVGYVFAIAPLVAEYRQHRADATRLEARIHALQDAVSRGRSSVAPDESAPLVLFDRRVSADDAVADVSERLARLAEDSAPKGGLRALRLTTGDVVEREGGAAPATPAATGADLRVGLFPTKVTVTPVTMTFESSYESVARLAWRVRGLPTLVDIESIELSRGLPYMRATLHLLVYRRAGVSAPPAGAVGGRP
jgi:hypothetical protein